MKNKLKQLLDPTLFRFLLVGGGQHRCGLWDHVRPVQSGRAPHLGDLGYWISSAANYVVGSVVSFFLNKHFTFRNEGARGRCGAPFCGEHRRMLGPGLRSVS